MTTGTDLRRPTITVGVDGTPNGDAALAWALAEAEVWDGRVDAVHVSPPSAALGWPGMPTGYHPEAAELHEVVEAALARVGRPGAVAIDVDVELGRPGPGLRAAAAGCGAAMVVVGRTHRGAASHLLQGSVDRILLEGDVPVVVVPPDWRAGDEPHGRIVVGVDGSARSETALMWAVGEATRRAAAVRAVLVWDDPQLARLDGAVPVAAVAEPSPGREARLRVGEVVAAARRRLAVGPRADITPAAVRGAARDVFLREAAEADLLVLGGRARRTLAQVLSGSTTRACVAESPAPVVVVPSGRG